MGPVIKRFVQAHGCPLKWLGQEISTRKAIHERARPFPRSWWSADPVQMSNVVDQLDHLIHGMHGRIATKPASS